MKKETFIKETILLKMLSKYSLKDLRNEFDFNKHKIRLFTYNIRKIKISISKECIKTEFKRKKVYY